MMQTVGDSRRPVVAILLFDRVEALDFAGPYEVFAGARDESGERYFRTITVGARSEIRCYGGLRVSPDVTLAECPSVDLLVVPGGPGARERGEGQDEVIGLIQRVSKETRVTASVCTGAFLLAKAGLLAGRRATTHSNRFDLFRSEFPDIELVRSKVVDEGSVITAGGVSSGIDLALYVLEIWFGVESRKREAARLEGPWK